MLLVLCIVEGYPERDYTPQGKLGQKVVAKWYDKTDGE